MHRTSLLLEHYFTSLTDEQLLYLYSIYIGEVPSPFHKQQLMDELVRFFCSPNTADSMAALLDREDREILVLLHHLKTPAYQRLHELYELRGYSTSQLSRKLMNLSERMVIIWREDSFAVHPLLEARISLSLDQIHTRQGAVSAACWFTPSLLAAWLVLAEQHQRLLSPQGTLKPHSTLQIRRLFSDHVTIEQLNAAAAAAVQLGLIYPGSREFSLNHQRIEHLFSLSHQQIQLHGAAAMIGGSFSDPDSLSQLLSFCRSDTFSQADMISLIMLFSGSSSHTAEKTLQRGCDVQLFTQHEGFYSCSPLAVSLEHQPTDHAVCTLSSDMRMHVDRAEESASWYKLYRCAELVRYDRMAILRLTENSLLTCLDGGLDFPGICDLLEEVTGASLSRNAVQILSGWADGYESIKLFEAVVLQCDQRLSRVITGHPKLSELVQLQLSDEVFLFSPDDLQRLRELLTDAGVPFVPRVIRPHAEGRTFEQKHFHHIRWPVNPPDTSDRALPDDLGMLDALKAELAGCKDETHTELSYRIDQKLVLSREQLERTSKRRMIFEAKGFDYQGKLQLIRQAIKTPSDILEITLQGKDQEPMMMKPTELYRELTKDILEGLTIPEDEKVTLAVGKLFMVRKIRRPLHLHRRDNSGR